MKRAGLLLLAVVLALGGLIAVGNHWSTHAQAGDQEDQAKPAASVTLSLEIKQLGLGTPADQIGMVLLVIGEDRSRTRQRGTTDSEGKISFEVPESATFRILAEHPWIVPEVYRRIDADALRSSLENDQPISVQVRSLHKVKLEGVVLNTKGKPAAGADVSVAPLDLQPDGSFTVFEAPDYMRTDKEGRFSVMVATGYYSVWASDRDRSTPNWDPFFKLLHKVDVFDDAEVELQLEAAPTITGRMINGQTGEGEDGVVDLFSNAYLASRNNFCEEGDEEQPRGTFEAELDSIDPENIDVVLRGEDADTSVRIISGLSLKELRENPELVIRPKGSPHLRARLVTAEDGIPMDQHIVSVKPTGKVDAPSYLRGYLNLETATDAEGWVEFWGLPKGSYTFYLGGGEFVLSEAQLTGGEQTLELEWKLHFATGKILYPDGSECTQAAGLIEVTDLNGQTYDPQFIPAFPNKHLAKENKYFVMFYPNLTYRFWFIAPLKDEPDGEIAYTSTPVEFTADEVYKLAQDIQLKPVEEED